MEILLRIAGFILNVISFLAQPILMFASGVLGKKVPPIKNKILTMSAAELADKIRKQEIKSEVIVRTYIERIKEVNQVVNAVVGERFFQAIADAQRADELCSKTPSSEIMAKYPLLGVPFTVKESCGVKGLSMAVGNVQRSGIKSTHDGDLIDRVKSAGGIPLLVSANPEYCLSWETSTLLNGTCKNPYDTRRSPGGSSGGEAALNSAGASVFGIGSDLAGSIRLPCLFTGIFGHKATGGLLSSKGHFPTSSDPEFVKYLQLGPMTRFAKDLPLLLQIMAGENAHKLEMHRNVQTKDIKIHYLDRYEYTLTRRPVRSDIQKSILKAVEHFRSNGLVVKKSPCFNVPNAMEIMLSAYCTLTDIPDLMAHVDNPKKRDNIYLEMVKHIVTCPKYSFAALFFLLLKETNGFMTKAKTQEYSKSLRTIRKELEEVLGDDGVLFYPTFTTPAFYHSASVLNLGSVPFCALFNVLGFPATHVPMGLDKDGLPIGFQVVAAPYKDKLCLTIAGELEAAFGGWVPPS